MDWTGREYRGENIGEKAGDLRKWTYSKMMPIMTALNMVLTLSRNVRWTYQNA